MTFKPLLASPADLDNLRFPLMASAKLDGVRAIVKDGVVLSRSLKKIPNLFVQSKFGVSEFEGFDGELIVGRPVSKTCYTDTVSGVMRISGEPDVRFYVFDDITWPKRGYYERRPRFPGTEGLVEVAQSIVHSLDELLAMEERHLTLGYEGLILRDPNAPYKFGRSTTKEGILLKLKRFTDSEFEVIGFEERQHNGNAATTNELGRTKRSSHAAGKSGLGDLGALVLQGDGFTFNCGTGFDDATRSEIWSNKPKYLGRLAKVKHFEVGAKIAPRHPVFLGFRNKLDI